MTTITLAKTDYTLAVGQTLSFTNENGIALSAIDPNDQPSVTIAGALQISATQGVTPQQLSGVTTGFSSFYGASLVDITATGSIHVDTSNTPDPGEAYGSGSWSAHVRNDGLVEVDARSSGTGLYVGGISNDTVPGIINNSLIKVIVTQGDAHGVNMTSGGTLDNVGTIFVSGAGSAVGAEFHQFGATFLNSGTIHAEDSNPTQDAVAVLFSASLKGAFLNSGVLEGEYALKVQSPFGDTATFDPTAIYQNTGKMIGAVDMGGGGVTLLNSGSITGAINLGAGDDRYDGSLGAETGLLRGGTGDDTLTGGAGFDNFQGNQGNDSEAGGAGDDIVVGGQGNDVQHGDDGDDVVWGNLGNDTLDGGNGNDQVRGGQGDDSIAGGAGNDFISGDRGNDTESGGAGADLFHGSQDAGVDRVLDFNPAEGDRVELDPGTTYTLSQVGADTVIDMGPGPGGTPNQMILVGVQLSTLKDGWIFESF